MVKRTFQFVLLACLATTSLWAEVDSFVGDWKLNPSKSTLIDRMKVASLGANKYTFDFGAGPEAVVLDGSDQPGVYGTMLSVTAAAPDNWKVVRKKDGRTQLTAIWKISQDANTLTDNYTEFGPNGEPSTTNYVYKRTAAGKGFAGTWESPTPIDSAYTLQIRPSGKTGLSLTNSLEKTTRDVQWDGKDYPRVGPDIAEGSTISARWVSERVLEITDRVKGTITQTERMEFSSDLKTLTRTVHPAGQQEPNIFVFERQ
jgi:hypothetical protein